MRFIVLLVCLVAAALLVPHASAVAPADFGLNDGEIIRAAGDVDIYIVNDWGYKRLFVNPAIFNLYGHLGWDKVEEVPAATRDAFPISGFFRNCESDDQKVWGLEVVSEDVANLHWVNVSGADAVSQDSNFFKKVFCINNAEQALYGTGSAYTSLSQVPDYTRSIGPATLSKPSPKRYSEGLAGAAGELRSADFVASVQNEKVFEGDVNRVVYALELEAESGSDLRVASFRMSFRYPGGTGSTDMGQYAKAATLRFGSVRGSLDPDTFESQAGGFGSAVAGLGYDGIITAGGKTILYIGIDAYSVIDSFNLGQEWDLRVDQLRYYDAQGAPVTDSDTGDIGEWRRFSFEALSEGGLELKLTEAADNPEESLALVLREDKETENVPLLSAMMSAEGSDITINEMTMVITADSGIPVGGDASELAYAYKLVINGVVVQSVNSDDCTAGTCDGTGAPPSTATYVFDDVDFELAEGASASVKVLADMNNIDGATFFSTNSLVAALDNADTDAEDKNGDPLGVAVLDGAVTGGEQVFGAEGPFPIFVGTSATAQTEDGQDLGTFAITFMMVSGEVDSYIQDECSNNGDGMSFGIIGSASFLDCAVSSTADDSDGAFGNFKVVDSAPPETFTLTVTVGGGDDFVQVNLLEFDWGLFDIANPLLFINVGLDDFETEPLYLSSL